MKNALRIVLLLLGLALCAWFVYRAGPARIMEALGRLGWLAPLVLLPYGVVYLLDTLGWRLAFGQCWPPSLSFLALFRVRWAGEAVNNLLPSAYVGGEAVKVYLLRKRGVSGQVAASSVVAGKTIHILAQVVFIVLGALAALGHLPPGSPVWTGMMVLSLMAVLGLVVLFLWQKRGMLESLLQLAARLPGRHRWLKAHVAACRQVDDQIRRFYSNERRSFLRSFLGYLAGWLCDPLEMFLVCWILGQPIPWSEALAIEAFIGVAKGLGFFVPAAVGIQESGVILLFHLFGLPTPLAVSYALIRRGRDVVYGLTGMLFLYSDEAGLNRLRVSSWSSSSS